MFKSLPLATAGCHLLTSLWLKKRTGFANLPIYPQPVIIAANHCSLLDGVVLCAELTWATRRSMHPLVTAEAFTRPLSGWVLRTTRAIPVVRNDSRSTVAALQTALGYLRCGETVTIFPEGHLNNGKTMRLPRPGMAFLALESGVPILPCGLRGTAEALPTDGRPHFKRCVEINLGDPIDTRDYSARYHAADAPARKLLVDELSGVAMRRIADLSGMKVHRHMH